MPDSLAGDLREHIYQSHANGPRKDSHWVMSPEWLNEIRKIDDSAGPIFRPSWNITAPQTLLGIPVDVRTDGDPPHLERNS